MAHTVPTHSDVNGGLLLMYHFFTLIWFLCVFSFGVHAAESYDPKAMYDRIKSLNAQRGILQEEHVGKMNPAKMSVWNLVCPTDACVASDKLTTELQAELNKRGETNPVAAFYAGLLNLEDAQKLNNSTMATELVKFVEMSSKDARKQLAFASSAGIAAASWNMGLIYETNLGVIGSKLAAIEWYGRAGHQYHKAGERETALAALEKMEKMDAKHVDSIRLRDVLYPTAKKK